MGTWGPNDRKGKKAPWLTVWLCCGAYRKLA